jgi:hypothetical protein
MIETDDNTKGLNWVLKELFFGVLPIIPFIQFVSEFFITQNNDLSLDYYYFLCTVAIVALSIESVLLQNGIIKNTACYTINKFRSKASLYLSLTFYGTFVGMTILNYSGLENHVTLFYIAIVVFGLSFLGLRQINYNYMKRTIPAKEQTQG